MYSSPSTRICLGKYFLWDRNRRRYKGKRGNSAKGAGRSPVVDPAAVGLASKRDVILIIKVRKAFEGSVEERGS